MNDKWNKWLAGLIEGDGSIVIPEARRKEGKKNNPHIQVALNIKDTELAKKIVIETGAGTIGEEGKTVRLTWRKKAEIINIIERIGGYMRTPKILRLHKLIDRYNEEDGSAIEKKGVDTTPIWESPWLSGMSDADSNFNIRIMEAENGYRVQRQWRLEVTQSTESENENEKGGDQKIWVEQVSAYLENNILSRHRMANRTKKMYSSYIIIAHSMKSLTKIEEYFEKYPLYSSKCLDYRDWKSCGKIVDKTPENSKKIQEIKSGMNSKRTYYNWDHLNT